MPGPIVVGAVAVDVVPSAKGFLAKLADEIAKPAARAGEQAGNEYAKGFEKTAADTARKAAKDALSGTGADAGAEGAKAGDKWGEGFNRSVGDKTSKASSLSGFAKQLDDLLSKLVSGIGDKAVVDDLGQQLNTELLDLRSRFSDMQIRLRSGLDPTELYSEVRNAGMVAERLANRITYKTDLNVEGLNTAGTIDSFTSGVEKAVGRVGELSKAADTFTDRWKNMSAASRVANGVVVGFLTALPALIAFVVAGFFGLLGVITAVGAAIGVLVAGIAVLALAFMPIIKAIQEREQAAKQAATQAAQDDATELANKIALRSATEAITDAEKSLRTARTRVTRASADVTKAEKKQKDARSALKDATKTARTELAKLNQEIRTNAVEQQKQIVTITQAREAYNRTLADPTSSQSDIQAAQATYNVAEQALKKLQVEQREQAEEKARFDRDGLAASASYKSALDSLASATESVTSANEQLADAIQSAADAQTNLNRARQSKVDTVAQQTAAATVATATREAATQTEDELPQAAKDFITFYDEHLKPIFDQFTNAAINSGILGAIESVFTSLEPIMPSIADAISKVGHYLGVFFIQIGNFLASGEGQEFIDAFVAILPDAFALLGDLAKSGLSILFDLFKALAPVIKDLAPVLGELVTTLAEDFSEWVKSGDFKELVDLMIANAPMLIKFIVEFGAAFLKLLLAIGPAATMFLQFATMVLDLLGKIPVGVIQTILVILGLIVGVVVAIAASGAIAAAGIAVVIAIVVGLVVAVVRNWDTVWAKTKEIWGYILVFFRGLWDSVKSVFSAAIGVVVAGFTGFWDQTKKIISLIGDGFKGFWEDTKKAFSLGVAAVGKIWDGLKFVLALPVVGFFAILNEGIVDPFNKIAGFFGGDGIDKFTPPKWATEATNTEKHFATGGIVPGYQSSRKDEVPAMLRKGEGILVPEVVKQLGAATVLEWNRRGLRGQSIAHYATGGVVDSDEPGGLAGWGLSKLKAVADPMVDAFQDRFGDNKLAQILVLGPAKLLVSAAKWMVDKALALGESIVSGLSDVGSKILDLFGGGDDEDSALSRSQGVMADPLTAARYAAQQGVKIGFDSTDLSYLAKLWNGESGWRWNAKNPDSGAYGIAQALPASKYAAAGDDWATNAFTQVDWGLAYIAERYKDPTNAYLAWLGRSPHWYDTGGYLPPGITLAVNGTGRPERVLTAEQEAALVADRSGGLGITVRVQDGAVRGLVSAEVDSAFGSLADAKIYGGP